MVHQKLKALREEKGYSQEELAAVLLMGQNTISNIETGKTKVGVELLYKFAEFYKIEPQELLNDNSLNMTFNDKVENGYINHIQTLNQDNKELINALKEQLLTKDKQIEKLLEIISSKNDL
jgi:transcriptional regulator with XRE-family HTH domain